MGQRSDAVTLTKRRQRQWLMQCLFSQSDMDQIWEVVEPQLWQCNCILSSRNIVLILCPVYYSKFISMYGVRMDLCRNGGNLSGEGSISSLILVCLISKYSLPWACTLVFQTFQSTTVIFFNHSYPRRIALFCQSLVFQVVDQIARPLSPAQESIKYKKVHWCDYWIVLWEKSWVIPTEQNKHVYFQFWIACISLLNCSSLVDTIWFQLRWNINETVQAFRGTLVNWKPQWATVFASVNGKGNKVCSRSKAVPFFFLFDKYLNNILPLSYSISIKK